MKKISGTKEWAEKNANVINGCAHGCRYCYAHSMQSRFRRLDGRSWEEEQLKYDPSTVRIKREKGRIMFPTVHDTTPENIQWNKIYIKRLLEVGNSLLFVSKPHFPCIKELCQEFGEYKSNIFFRFTIGSIDNDVLRFWEPYAPLFEERLESLQHAFISGFSTSVSMEPMLEGDRDKLIDTVSPYVTDTIWLGKVNRLKSILKLNGFTEKEYISRAETLITSQNDDVIRDLYERYKNNPKIRFKESIKKVVGIELLPKPGMDL